MATIATNTRVRPSRFGVVGSALAKPLANYYLVLVGTVLLVGLGSLMVLSASSVYASATNGGNSYYYAERQALYLAIGIPATWWLSRRDERQLKTISWISVVVAIVLLTLVFSPLGASIKGNRAWLDLKLMSIQPSEFAKFALVLFCAHFLALKHKALDSAKALAPLGIVFALIAGLIAAEKDLGTLLVIAVIFFGLLWLVGIPWKFLGALLTVGVTGVAVLVLSSPNRMTRIWAFLSGTGDDPNASQQPLSAVYGLASGGWWGLGLGASRQKWGGLYDGAQNDFVFAVLGEELGLFGTLSVLLLFLVLAYAGVRIALNSTSLFRRIAAAGCTIWIMFQMAVNVGVAMKLLPVVGLPLPFISAGGSALLANLMAVGVLLSCARAEPAAQRLLAARRGEPAPRVTTVVDAQSGRK